MAFKTLVLKIHNPGRRKREIMDSAMRSYTLALQHLLDVCGGELREMALSGEPVSRTRLLRLLSKQTLLDLNRFGVQPFKDSIKMEFAVLAATYIAQMRRNPRAGFPGILPDVGEELAGTIARFDSGALSEDALTARLSRLLDRRGEIRPIYFGRYALNRDYCLLHDAQSDRFFVKLYLLNSAQRVESAARGASGLRYVAPGLPPFAHAEHRQAFLILPLSFGTYQQKTLRYALEDPSILRTARLLKREDVYYLEVNVEVQAPKTVETQAVLGVARNGVGGLNYTLCTEDGQILRNGRTKAVLGGETAASKLTYYLMAKEIVRFARRHKARVVLEAAGGKKDEALPHGPGKKPMKTTEYAALADIFGYKLPEAGLPEPALVSPNRLNLTCPVCGAATRRNRLTEELFACVECGYAGPSEFIGSLNLARKLKKYGNDKVPVYLDRIGGELVFYNKCLDFRYVMPAKNPDYTEVFYQLSLLANGPQDYEPDSRRYSMLRKLRDARSIRSVVRFAGRGGQTFPEL